MTCLSLVLTEQWTLHAYPYYPQIDEEKNDTGLHRDGVQTALVAFSCKESSWYALYIYPSTIH